MEPKDLSFEKKKAIPFQGADFSLLSDTPILIFQASICNDYFVCHLKYDLGKILAIYFM